MMKLNKNNWLENLRDPFFGSSNSKPWGSPNLLSNLLKSKNKKRRELEGLT